MTAQLRAVIRVSRFALFAAVLALPLAAQVTAAPNRSADSAPLPVPREMRGVWVATVNNIDWPSRPGLTTREQQDEMLAILDRAAELNLNTVIFQVRPAGDALYASRLEPWSEYLSGQQGKAPVPFYDPLAFVVAEAHARGLELHAWFNPYRARQSGGSERPARTHMSVTHPRLVKTYGKQLWMDPGEPAVRRHTLAVIADVVKRYDIDGVHLDDYFYPYPERVGGGDTSLVPFPDKPSWTRYQKSGGTLSRDDWRRQNVNSLISEMYAEVKRLKPWVKVGIAPFGIGRPGEPPQITGFDAYGKLWADAPLWLEKGWADYFTPQLYWPIAQLPQSYPVLLKWWVEHNPHGRNIWPGNFTSGARQLGPWPPSEIREQIRLTRAQLGASGNIHFSMKALMESVASDSADPLALQLVNNEYAEKALVPASPWLGRGAPVAPTGRIIPDARTGGMQLRITPASKTVARLWLISLRDSTVGWRTIVVPSSQLSYALTSGPSTELPIETRVSAVDRVGVEGPARVIPRPTAAPPKR